MISDIRSVIRHLSDVSWPAGSMLLVDIEDYELLKTELLHVSTEAIIPLRGAEGTKLEIADAYQYDRAAYKRANQVMNERIRPRGTQMEPYACESCDHQILLVTKSPKHVLGHPCDVCQGRMVRTTT